MIDESNRHYGSGHRMVLDIDLALAALPPVGCVGDGWSIPQETLNGRM